MIAIFRLRFSLPEHTAVCELTFDIETVPDTELGKQLYAVGDLEPKVIAQLMFNRRQQETDGQSEFLRLHQHRIVAISAVWHKQAQCKVSSFGSLEADEKTIIESFFNTIERHSPTLISWNGSGFDLPVLHYRALLHGIACPRYWEDGSEDKSFRWNNYHSRYHSRHTDLMDVLAGYNPRAYASLNETALMLGLPGKLGMDGKQVWEHWLHGDLTAIRNYCETDVLNTWLIYLRFQLMRGRLDKTRYQQHCESLLSLLRQETDKPHLQQFLSAWQTG